VGVTAQVCHRIRELQRRLKGDSCFLRFQPGHSIASFKESGRVSVCSPSLRSKHPYAGCVLRNEYFALIGSWTISAVDRHSKTGLGENAQYPLGFRLAPNRLSLTCAI
jgi:hypothetical protein